MFQYFPTPTRWMWLPYICVLFAFFVTVKYFNVRLHRMFDTQQCVEEEEEEDDEEENEEGRDADAINSADDSDGRKNALNARRRRNRRRHGPRGGLSGHQEEGIELQEINQQQQQHGDQQRRPAFMSRMELALSSGMEVAVRRAARAGGDGANSGLGGALDGAAALVAERTDDNRTFGKPALGLAVHVFRHVHCNFFLYLRPKSRRALKARTSRRLR